MMLARCNNYDANHFLKLEYFFVNGKMRRTRHGRDSVQARKLVAGWNSRVSKGRGRGVPVGAGPASLSAALGGSRRGPLRLVCVPPVDFLLAMPH
jgi:hypothetical protein